MSEELGGNMKCTCTEVDEYGWHDEDCLLIKNKTNLIDLDKIEEELKQFSPENTLTFQGVKFYSDSMMDFCKKSPERIAALVKMVKELRGYISELESASKELLINIAPILETCGQELPPSYLELIKRGSDEV